MLDESLAEQEQEGAWGTVLPMLRLPGAAQIDGTVKTCVLHEIALHMVQTGRVSTVGPLLGVKGLAVLGTTWHHVNSSHRH